MAKPDIKLFDLHIEFGTTPNGTFYAHTVVGNVSFRKESLHAADAICDLVCHLDTLNTFGMLATNPKLSVFPLGSYSSGQPAITPNQKSAPAKQTYTGPRKRPIELGKVPHPDCQSVCISYDNFGRAKCKSMCARKPGT